jgi:hypothetical protein
VFENVRGQFGVPNILCSYIVADGQGLVEASSRIVPDDAKYWPVFNTTADHPAPEQWRHTRTLYLTRGKPLVAAEGPQQLLAGILHAMLGDIPSALQSFNKYLNTHSGHWNLFKAGWLHRDVSNGNVMLLTEAEERSPVSE